MKVQQAEALFRAADAAGLRVVGVSMGRGALTEYVKDQGEGVAHVYATRETPSVVYPDNPPSDVLSIAYGDRRVQIIVTDEIDGTRVEFAAP